MMEFTLTRVVLCVAGILVLGAILTPVMDMFEERDDTSYQGQSDNITSMIETINASNTYKMTIYFNKNHQNK